MTKELFREWVLCIILSVAFQNTYAQSNVITLEGAIGIARENYAGLERDRLTIAQYKRLASTGVPVQPTQLYISGEEFGSNNQSGVHSLNVFQNFYLPKVSQSQRAYYRQGADLAEKQLELTDGELKRQVEQAFYQLQYAEEALTLATENVTINEEFLNVTTIQLETGETGRLPQMAARTRLAQARLEKQHADEGYKIALSIFNQWLQSDMTYTAEGSLRMPTEIIIDSLGSDNRHLQYLQSQKQLATANIETQKAQLLPQINSGFKFQTAFGNFPLFGYQIGLNVPLFKKAYQGRIEAAEIEVKVQEATIKTEQQNLERTITELQYRLGHQREVLQYLQEVLTPIVNDQATVNLTAYREGEVGYLEYLDGMEQVIKVKRQYLEALYEFHIYKSDLDYWTGQ